MSDRTNASVPSGRARNSGGTAWAPSQVGTTSMRSFASQAVGHLEQAKLGLEVQPVAGLRLDRRDAVAEHLVEPAPTVGEQLALGRGAGRGDRRQDPAALGQDVEIRGAPLAHDELVLARAREHQVRVRVDEPGRDRPARGIDPGEPAERETLRFQGGLDRGPRPHGHDAALPASDRRGVGSGRIIGTEAPDLALFGTAPDAPLEGDDFRCSDDQEARRLLTGAATLDDAERAAHPGRASGGVGAPLISARRNSRAWVGEKSRSRRYSAAARNRSSMGASGIGVGSLGDSEERGQWGEADEFGFGQFDAVLGGHVANRLPDHPERRDREVEQVHRHLRAERLPAFGLTDLEAVGLDARQAAAGFADATGDALGQVDVVGIEVDVVGDEERTRADGDRAGRGMQPGGPEVRLAPALADLAAQALVLAAPHVGQLLAVRPQRCPGVQVDGQLEPLRDPFPERAGKVDAGIHRGIAERDERDHIDRTDPGVLALVDVHVDLVHGGLDESLQGVTDRPVFAGHGEDGPVVAGIARPVEQRHAADRADRLGHPVDDIEPATF